MRLDEGAAKRPPGRYEYEGQQRQELIVPTGGCGDRQLHEADRRQHGDEHQAGWRAVAQPLGDQWTDEDQQPRAKDDQGNITEKRERVPKVIGVDAERGVLRRQKADDAAVLRRRAKARPEHQGQTHRRHREDDRHSSSATADEKDERTQPDQEVDESEGELGDEHESQDRREVHDVRPRRSLAHPEIRVQREDREQRDRRFEERRRPRRDRQWQQRERARGERRYRRSEPSSRRSKQQHVGDERDRYVGQACREQGTHRERTADPNGNAEDPHGERGVGEELGPRWVDMLLELEEVTEQVVREPTAGPLHVDNLVVAPGHVIRLVQPKYQSERDRHD